MTLEFDDGEAYHEDKQLATVVWVQYTGEEQELDQQYLLMNRNKDLGEGKWMGLGGKIEQKDFEALDETPYSIYDRIREAAKENAEREVSEESGVSIDNIEQIGRIDRYNLPGSDMHDEWEIYHFLAETSETPDDYDHREGQLAWHPPDELDELEFGMEQDEVIDYIREEKPFTGWINDIEDPYGVASEEGYAIQLSEEPPR